jgi:hypothetical protein
VLSALALVVRVVVPSWRGPETATATARAVSAAEGAPAKGPMAPVLPGPDAEIVPSEDQLVALQAYLYWIEQGKPTGPEGEAAQQANDQRARKIVRDRIDRIAYNAWVQRGSKVFSDAESNQRESLENWTAAHRILRQRLDRAIAAASEQPASPSP